MTAPDLDPTGAFVRWLVEVVHYPFDYLFNSPPPVDHALIAAHWKAYDDWDCTIEEAREIIRQETGV